MLLQFTLANYRSFKDSTSLNLKAHALKEHTENIFSSAYGSLPVSLLKSLVLLGANSSGKSNLFKGFDLMRNMVMYSAIETGGSKINKIEPFRLNTETEHKHTLFECTMIIDSICYRYGFKSNSQEIHSEWLYMVAKRREEIVFIRTKNEYEIVKRFPTNYKNKLLMLTELTRNDALYISVLTRFNIDMGLQISNWFASNITYGEPDLCDAINYTVELLADPVYGTLLNEIIKESDLGFNEIEKQIGDLRINHIKYDARNRPVGNVFFELTRQESSGTQKLIALLGPLIKVLVEGGTLWIDEFDAKIHPYIVTMIMGFFNSAKYNKHGAQLIAITYNQQILKKLRRDQIVFMNKDTYGASSLGALYNSNLNVRSNALFDKEYLQGTYGGIPNINNTLQIDLEHANRETGVNGYKNGHN